jgi:two-component system cell cycle response regulator
MTPTILIVDDETESRALLEAILTDAGYRVESTEGGPAALAHATAAPPDLILLDLMMPRMNGFQLCRQLKQEPTTSTVPIIVVTVLGEIQHKERALTSGADDFVTKPVRPEDLRARVAAMLKVPHAHQEIDRALAYLHELNTARQAQRQEILARLAAGVPPGSPRPPAAMSVLLVDDEPLICQFYADLLADRGFQVFVASNGADGLEQARRHPVEAVILDIRMPQMSGLEVLQHLRVQDPDLPIIILTAYPTSRNAITALKLGAFDFISKGMEHDLVVLAVHRAIRHRRNSLERKQETERLRGRIVELERDSRQHLPRQAARS